MSYLGVAHLLIPWEKLPLNKIIKCRENGPCKLPCYFGHQGTRFQFDINRFSNISKVLYVNYTNPTRAHLMLSRVQKDDAGVFTCTMLYSPYRYSPGITPMRGKLIVIPSPPTTTTTAPTTQNDISSLKIDFDECLMFVKDILIPFLLCVLVLELLWIAVPDHQIKRWFVLESFITIV